MSASTEEIKIACPHCGQHILVETSMLGTELECPTCNKSFTMKEADAKGTEARAPSSSEHKFPEDELSPTPEPANESVIDSSAGQSSSPDKSPEWKTRITNLMNSCCKVLAKMALAIKRHSKRTFEMAAHKWNSLTPKRRKQTRIAAAVVFSFLLLVGIFKPSSRPDNSFAGEFSDSFANANTELSSFSKKAGTSRKDMLGTTNPDRRSQSNRDEKKTAVPKPKPKMASAKGRSPSVSDYLFDSDRINKFFSREMTSAKMDVFAKEQCNRGLLLAGRRRLFAPIPDGTVFKVEHVYRDMENNPEIMVVKVSLVSAEHGIGGWEFKHSMESLGDEDYYRGTAWPNAPWKEQTDTKCEELTAKCFPNAHESLITMCMYRTGKVIDQLRQWNLGTFLVSKGWYSALPVSTDEGYPQIASDYWIIPSVEDIMKLAFDDAKEPSTSFSTIGPRKEADRILAEMENHRHGFAHSALDLEKLLRDLSKHHPSPGKALKSLIESVFPSGFEYHIQEIKELISSAGGNDRTAFEQSLAKAVKKLSDYNSLPVSASVPSSMRLDEHLVSEFYKDGQSWGTFGNKLRQMEVFNRLWSSGSSSLLRKDYYHVLFLPFPDGISFVVRDVSTDGIRHQITMSPLVHGQSASYGDKSPWTGNSKQDEALLSYLDERYGTGTNPSTECLIDFPLSDKKAANWDVGTIIKSDGWICEAFVKEANVTKTNRQTGQSWKEEEREIVFLRCFSPSIKARLEIERAASEWVKNH